MTKYQSYSGYFGALSVISLTFFLVYLKSNSTISTISNTLIFLIVLVTFINMIIGEYFLKKIYNKKNNYQVIYKQLHKQNLYILKSTLIRFVAFFVPFLFFYLLVQYHEYFLHNSLFKPTQEFFNYLLYIFLIFGVPYIYLTLKYRGDSRYEFGDYAILTIIGVKSLYKSIVNKSYSRNFHHNRRVKKVWLLYLVNFFFLTLMARFIITEFHGFEKEIFVLISNEYDTLNWYMQFKTWFLVFFHLIFTVDVSIAIIGYSFASRWLNNRTKSVDDTLGGWIIALMCYPPINSVTSQFISYHGLSTHQIITNEYALTLILSLVIIFFTIYVWSTVALGFKFSNLTNRGVVDIGPYKYVRHPAYTSKNLSWWLDNTFIFTNIWAIVAMIMWNAIYITRALTEERHLQKDKEYIEYCKKVKYRFIPKLL
jgi:protein-S-isoprenylcysteine O-methyltransferase Ste14